MLVIARARNAKPGNGIRQASQWRRIELPPVADYAGYSEIYSALFDDQADRLRDGNVKLVDLASAALGWRHRDGRTAVLGAISVPNHGAVVCGSGTHEGIVEFAASKYSRPRRRCEREDVMDVVPRKKDLAERNKISLEDDNEAEYWMRHFGISRAVLEHAISRVGNSVAAVKKQLGKNNRKKNSLSINRPETDSCKNPPHRNQEENGGKKPHQAQFCRHQKPLDE